MKLKFISEVKEPLLPDFEIYLMIVKTCRVEKKIYKKQTKTNHHHQLLEIVFL